MLLNNYFSLMPARLAYDKVPNTPDFGFTPDASQTPNGQMTQEEWNAMRETQNLREDLDNTPRQYPDSPLDENGRPIRETALQVHARRQAERDSRVGRTELQKELEQERFLEKQRAEDREVTIEANRKGWSDENIAFEGYVQSVVDKKTDGKELTQSEKQLTQWYERATYEANMMPSSDLTSQALEGKIAWKKNEYKREGKWEYQPEADTSAQEAEEAAMKEASEENERNKKRQLIPKFYAENGMEGVYILWDPTTNEPFRNNKGEMVATVDEYGRPRVGLLPEEAATIAGIRPNVKPKKAVDSPVINMDGSSAIDITQDDWEDQLSGSAATGPRGMPPLRENAGQGVAIFDPEDLTRGTTGKGATSKPKQSNNYGDLPNLEPTQSSEEVKRVPKRSETKSKQPEISQYIANLGDAPLKSLAERGNEMAQREWARRNGMEMQEAQDSAQENQEQSPELTPQHVQKLSEEYMYYADREPTREELKKFNQMRLTEGYEGVDFSVGKFVDGEFNSKYGKPVILTNVNRKNLDEIRRAPKHGANYYIDGQYVYIPEGQPIPKDISTIRNDYEIEGNAVDLGTQDLQEAYRKGSKKAEAELKRRYPLSEQDRQDIYNVFNRIVNDEPHETPPQEMFDIVHSMKISGQYPEYNTTVSLAGYYMTHVHTMDNRYGFGSRRRGSGERLEPKQVRKNAEGRAKRVENAKTKLEKAMESGNKGKIRSAYNSLLQAYERAGEAHLYAVRRSGGEKWERDQRTDVFIRNSKKLEKAIDAAQTALNQNADDLADKVNAVEEVYQSIKAIKVAESGEYSTVEVESSPVPQMPEAVDEAGGDNPEDAEIPEPGLDEGEPEAIEDKAEDEAKGEEDKPQEI